MGRIGGIPGSACDSRLSSSAPVVALAGYDMAHAAGGIGGVAVVAGNDVKVEVENRLAGCLADVDAYVIAVGRVLLLDDFADLIHGAEQL